MKRKKRVILLLITIVATILLFINWNTSIVAGHWTKQSIFLWILNCGHIQAKGARPRILLIDDDGGEGVYKVKQLCDELHMKATFAVIPSMMSQKIKDSLRSWQKQGYGIAFHGYNHEDWKEKTFEEIKNDITKSEEWLSASSFMPLKNKYVVAPHGSNTLAIRNAIKDKGYQMVTGANILNPDTHVFQLGRIFITPNTDLGKMESLLKKAKKKNLYVILGTHSSIHHEFSAEKTREILKMAQRMGFDYQH